MKKIKADIQVENHGTLFLFRPLTPEGKEWLETATVTEPWQWLGGALAVEHRYANNLAEAAHYDGGLNVI